MVTWGIFFAATFMCGVFVFTDINKLVNLNRQLFVGWPLSKELWLKIIQSRLFIVNIVYSVEHLYVEKEIE